MPPAENILQKARFFISQNLGNRYNDMEDVVRANFLLDHALQVFSQKNDDCQLLVLKGGSALQRVYQSPRFSSDLDFCIAKDRENFSPYQFIEFGEYFKEHFEKCILDAYDNKNIDVKAILPFPAKSLSKEEIVDEILKTGFFGSYKSVVHFIIHAEYHTEIPARDRFRRAIESTKNEPKKQNIKIDICNLPSGEYSELEVVPIDMASFAQFPTLNVANIDDIHNEKMLSGLSRINLINRPHKYSDFFDQYYTEWLLGGDIPVFDEKLFMEKIHRQFCNVAKGSDITAAVRDVINIYEKNKNIFFKDNHIKMSLAPLFFSHAGKHLREACRLRFARNMKSQQLFFQFASGRYTVMRKMLSGASWYDYADSLVSANDIYDAIADSDDTLLENTIAPC